MLKTAVPLLPVGVAEVGILGPPDRLAAPGAWLAWPELLDQLAAQRLVLGAITAGRARRPGIALPVGYRLARLASLTTRRRGLVVQVAAAAG